MLAASKKIQEALPGYHDDLEKADGVLRFEILERINNLSSKVLAETSITTWTCPEYQKEIEITNHIAGGQ